MPTRDVVQVNWIPSSFEEFRAAAQDGRVELNIMEEQYPWLYREVVPFSPLSSKARYKRKVLERMVSDKRVFTQVHEKGIDLMLLG